MWCVGTWGGPALSRFIRKPRELYSRSDKRVPKHALISTHLVSMMFCASETRSSLVLEVIDIDAMWLAGPWMALA